MAVYIPETEREPNVEFGLYVGKIYLKTGLLVRESFSVAYGELETSVSVL